MSTLRIIDGPGAGLAIELTGSELSIGRDPGCSLQLGDVKASRRHAVLQQRDGGWQLKDLGSANGTWLERQRIAEISLEDGCEFRIGTTILRFEDENAEPAAGTSEDSQWGDTISGLEESQLFARGAVAGSNNQRDEYLVLLHEVVRRSHQARDREQLFDLLDDIAADALEGDRCAVFLPQGDGWLLWPPHERRLRARFGATPFAGTLLQRARQRPEALLCTDRGDVNPSMSMAQAGLRSAMVAPLRIGDDLHALVYVDRLQAGTPFTRTDLEFLQAAANQLAVRLHNMRELTRLEAEVERLSVQRPQASVELIGSDHCLRPIREFIAHNGESNSPLVIIGESGSGKHSVAKAIHQASAHAAAPMQVFACAAYDEASCELSLFGRAAAGVEDAQPGILELADGGSVVLQDVGQLSPLLQRRLLALINQHQVQRRGDAHPRKVQVRLMITLSQAPQHDEIIPELGSHLEFNQLSLPPLRQRPDDIELLAEYFIRDAAGRLDQPCRQLSAEAKRILLGHHWPGNIRQLRQAIERATLNASGKVIEADDLPASLHEQRADEEVEQLTPLVSLSEMERRHILHVLDHCGGNKKAAAELLGIDRSTLYAKLRQYGVHG